MPKLIIVTKNGPHRRERSFEITQEQATDPLERAKAIGAKSMQTTTGGGRVVNWRIEE